MDKGKLFIVATPIGNLKDITIRALETLEKVDLIAAEDTRHTKKLLSHYSISTPCISYHQHNERAQTKVLIDKMERGIDLALVSDAGTPGLSDPGYRLISASIEEGIEVVVIPGPSSLISALVASGLPTSGFNFLGFLPKGRGERIRALKAEADTKRTLVFFESPHRIASFLGETLEALGDRKVVVAREITKKFEEIIRGSLSEVLEKVKKEGLKGEMVVLIEGAPDLPTKIDLSKIRSEVIALMGEGITKKEAMAEVALRHRLPKREVFEAAKDIAYKAGGPQSS